MVNIFFWLRENQVYILLQKIMRRRQIPIVRAITKILRLPGAKQLKRVK